MLLSIPHQASALMGLGLLYEGTGHRFIALLLLHELSRRPAVDKQIEREAAAWAAGYCDAPCFGLSVNVCFRKHILGMHFGASQKYSTFTEFIYLRLFFPPFLLPSPPLTHASSFLSLSSPFPSPPCVAVLRSAVSVWRAAAVRCPASPICIWTRV
jgi:hypothetical protein